MARLSGVDLPREKRMEIALTYIYGVGRTRAKETLEATGVSPDLRARDLSDEDLVKLRDHLEASYQLEGDLRDPGQADQGVAHRRRLDHLLLPHERDSGRARRSPGANRLGGGHPGDAPPPIGSGAVGPVTHLGP